MQSPKAERLRSVPGESGAKFGRRPWPVTRDPDVVLVVEQRHIKLAQACWVSENVDFDDLPAGDREAHDGYQPSLWSRDKSRSSVHERWLCEPGKPRERERLRGHRRRVANHLRCTRRHLAGVGSKHDVGVEHRKQRVEVAAARGNTDMS